MMQTYYVGFKKRKEGLKCRQFQLRKKYQGSYCRDFLCEVGKEYRLSAGYFYVHASPLRCLYSYPLPEKTLATSTESTLTFAGTSWVLMGNIFLSALKIKKNLVKSSEEIRQQLLLREKLAGNRELLF